MARSTEVAVSPDVLLWARRSIGYDVPDAAKRLQLAPGRLVEFEEGASDPTISQLRKMARVYGRPLAAFFLHEPPRDFDVMRDFRRVSDDRRPWSPNLHKVFRRVEAQREIVIDLLEDEGAPPVSLVPTLELGTDAEAAAHFAREALGLDLQTQMSWRGPYDALNGWISAVERLGVLVLQTSDVHTNEMRGFSIADGVAPAIVLNGSDAPRGRVFTVAHELGHLVIRQGGLCDLHDSTRSGSGDLEVYCNEFAASLLMPRAAFLSEPLVARSSGPDEWTDDDLEQLSHRYGVSREAVLRRLVTVGRASMSHYVRRRAEFQEAYEQYESERRAQAKREGRQSRRQVATMTVRDLGKPYVRLVLDAYGRRSISASTLSDHLGVRLKHVAKITERVRG